jgi:predicted DNA-binding transcriptional regulator AlpA
LSHWYVPPKGKRIRNHGVRGTREKGDVVMNKNRLLSTKETAERLGCAMSSLWRWLKEIPDFPPLVRTGIRKRGFYESDVDAYLLRRGQK